MGFISMLGNISFLVGIIGAAVIFAILLVTFNTMMMAARERTSEIAVMKTLGYPDNLILFIVIGEAILISVVGGPGHFGVGALRGRAVEPGRLRVQHAGDALHVRPGHRVVDRHGRFVRAGAGHPGLAPQDRRSLPAGGVTMAIPLQYNVRNLFVRKLTTTITIVGIGLVVGPWLRWRWRRLEPRWPATGCPATPSSCAPGQRRTVQFDHPQWAAINTQPEMPGHRRQPVQVNEQVVVINLKRKSTGISNILPAAQAHGVRPAAAGQAALRRSVRPRHRRDHRGQVHRSFRARAGRSPQPGGRRTIVGVFPPTRFESEICATARLIPAFDRGEYQSSTVRLADPAYFDALQKRLEADKRLQVKVKRESRYYADQSVGVANTIRGLGTFVTVIMALGAMFGALNTMYAAVSARRAEIGTLLALGFGRGSVLLSFVFESILLASLGGLLGCLLALPVNGISTGTTNFATFSEVAFRITVTPAILGFGMIFALFMGVGGGGIMKPHCGKRGGHERNRECGGHAGRAVGDGARAAAFSCNSANRPAAPAHLLQTHNPVTGTLGPEVLSARREDNRYCSHRPRPVTGA
jgi:putative ABC transport system permease protein